MQDDGEDRRMGANDGRREVSRSLANTEGALVLKNEEEKHVLSSIFFV